MTEQEKNDDLDRTMEALMEATKRLDKFIKELDKTLVEKEIGELLGRKARIFIAGPVAGVKPEVYENQFATVKSDLESAGHEVINPLTDIPHRDTTNWGLTVMECLPFVAECDCMVMLPGWKKSDEALIGYHFARGYNMQVLQVSFDGEPDSRRTRKSRNRKQL